MEVNSQETIDSINKMVENNDNAIECFDTLEKLLKKGKINDNLYFNSFNTIVNKFHVYDNNIIPIINNLLKKSFNLTEISDDILLDVIGNCKNVCELMFIIFVLTKPKILYNNPEEILEDNKRVIKNLDKLVDFFSTKSPVFDSPDHLMQFVFVNYNYYHVYNGLNNAHLYKQVSKLNTLLCKDLNYVSPRLNHKNEKIKIGFMSNFLLKDHSVCRDRLGIIISLILDNMFDVYIIVNEDDPQLIYTQLTKNLNFQNKILINKNIKESREIIEKLELDILVYPEIGMDYFFYILAHSRLAPIQINTWGHSETSGIEAIDYFFSSKYYEDESNQKNYSEKLVLLDSMSTYYWSLRIFSFYEKLTTDRNKALATFDLSSKCNIYGVFQSVFKYHPDNITLIKRILEKDPKALIVFLSYPKLEDRFMTYLDEQLGYLVNRVRIIKRMDTAKYCELVNSMDIVLDSYPFGGCNSSLEALFLNKIVITLPVDKINGRFTLGFYKKMGIMEPVCKDFDEYVEKAVYYMNNKEEKQKLQDRIKENCNKLFEENESIDTWKRKLIQLANKPLNNMISNVSSEEAKLTAILNAHYDAIVIGSGFSGAVIAERLATLFNKKVLVIDDKMHKGGLTFEENNRGKYKHNIFHTNNEKVWNYISKFGEWTKYEHKVVKEVNGKNVSYPININSINELYNVKLTNDAEAKEYINKNNLLNGEDIKYDFDNRYYKDLYQYIPSNGYNNIFDNLLGNKNILVLLNVDYNLIKSKFSKDTPVFYTDRIDRLFKSTELEYKTIESTISDNIECSCLIKEDRTYVNYKYLYNQNKSETVCEKIVNINENNKVPIYIGNSIDKFNELKTKLDKNIYLVGGIANYKNMEIDEEINESLEIVEQVFKDKVEIVVARYNEDLEWLKDYKSFSTIYNKGEYIDNAIRLPNVGRESHTYLYHIIKNYDNLAEITLFTQGDLLNHTNIPIAEYFNCDGYKSFYDCRYLNIDNRGIMIHHGKWLEEINTGHMKRAEISFVDWWKKYVGTDLRDFCYNPGAIFAVSKDRITRKPKEFYIELLNAISNHVNDELGHYYERCWRTLFS